MVWYRIVEAFSREPQLPPGVLPNRQIVPKVLDLNALDQVKSLTPSERQEIEAIWLHQLDASFRGLVVVRPRVPCHC